MPNKIRYCKVCSSELNYRYDNINGMVYIKCKEGCIRICGLSYVTTSNGVLAEAYRRSYTIMKCP